MSISRQIHQPVIVYRTDLENMIHHTFAYFMDRPTYPYYGAPRFRLDGTLRHERHFSIKQKSVWGVKWAMDDQAWAVGEGFFFHRSNSANKVNIIGVDPFGSVFPRGGSHACLAELERRMFEVTKYDQTLYRRAWKFIEQQDNFGYSGAWDPEVQFFSSTLMWYKHWTAKRRLAGNRTPRDAEIAARIDGLRENAAKARPSRYAAKARRIILEGSGLLISRPKSHYLRGPWRTRRTGVIEYVRAWLIDHEWELYQRKMARRHSWMIAYDPDECELYIGLYRQNLIRRRSRFDGSALRIAIDDARSGYPVGMKALALLETWRFEHP